MPGTIAILDYDMANLRSVQKGFETVGAAAAIVRDPRDARRYDKLVLPGVGAFADAVRTLRERGLADAVCEHVRSGKPLLGICLGLQVLFEKGLEDGEHDGLGIFAGDCVRLAVDRTRKLKVPHMGWNQLRVVRRSPLLEKLPDGAGVYFVHSYHVRPSDPAIIASVTDYGGEFVSSIWAGNVMATQFHPEKSQKVGLQMLAGFAGL